MFSGEFNMFCRHVIESHKTTTNVKTVSKLKSSQVEKFYDISFSHGLLLYQSILIDQTK